jgi:hypothetical protein
MANVNIINENNNVMSCNQYSVICNNNNDN